LSFSAHWNTPPSELNRAFAEMPDRQDSPRSAIVVANVPNKGEPAPAAIWASPPYAKLATDEFLVRVVQERTGPRP
jgi:hypothetical protein